MSYVKDPFQGIPQTEQWLIVCNDCPLPDCVINHRILKNEQCPSYQSSKAGLGPKQTLALLGPEQDLWLFEDKLNGMAPVEPAPAAKPSVYKHELWKTLLERYKDGDIITRTEIITAIQHQGHTANNFIRMMTGDGRLELVKRASFGQSEYRINTMPHHATMPRKSQKAGGAVRSTTPTS